jgi:hypothetical protein
MSIRTSSSVFEELQLLRVAIEQSLRATEKTDHVSDPDHTKLSRNLHSFASAAKVFHYSASSGRDSPGCGAR